VLLLSTYLLCVNHAFNCGGGKSVQVPGSWSLVLNFLEIDISKFTKSKKILDVGNNIRYGLAKS
jgi:hypothetical protein